MIYYGTSGIALPVASKQLFPEAFRDKSRLIYYATLFNSLEINSTFKKLPMASTVGKWADSVPEGFQFTFKFPAAVTHNKALFFMPDDVNNFLKIADHAAPKKGCLLMQFPGKLTSAYAAELETLLQLIKSFHAAKEWKIAVEFRHISWYNSDTYKLLDIHAAAMVLHDLPPAPPDVDGFTGAFVYLRFHGTERGYRGSYSGEFLKEYAERIRQWQAAGKVVYVYFNNTLGEAAANLISLKRFVEDL